MKKILFLLTFLSLFVFSTQAQNVVKYEGAKIPLGIYWEVVSNTDAYFKSKMKKKEVYFYVSYLGENIENSEIQTKNKSFLKAIKIDLKNLNLKKVENMRIGKNGVAGRIKWNGKNKIGKDCEFYLYLYMSAERKGKVKYYTMVYEEQCAYKGNCEKYWLHRESFEKEFQVK